MVLKLWPIVETSVTSEHDGITVRQTVAHTVQLRPRGLGTPCGSDLSRRRTQYVGSRANLLKLKQFDTTSLNLCSVVVEPVDAVRDVGVILDDELSM